jgi:hypothetical protein
VQPGAYVSCGRVAVEFSGARDTPSWQPANQQEPRHVRPLRFTLRLLDVPAMLAASPGKADRGKTKTDAREDDGEVTTFAGILAASLS